MRPYLTSALFLLPFLAVTPALAQSAPQGAAAVGRDLARQWCVACHVVETGSTAAPARGTDSVPSFAEIARRTGTTGDTLRAFLRNPHIKGMPDPGLDTNQIEQISAYILSLK